MDNLTSFDTLDARFWEKVRTLPKPEALALLQSVFDMDEIELRFMLAIERGEIEGDAVVEK
jgi:hypothetical protein